MAFTRTIFLALDLCVEPKGIVSWDFATWRAARWEW